MARGCGGQHLVVYINLAMFYLIGMPIAVVLGFKLKQYAKVTNTAFICRMFISMMFSQYISVVPVNMFIFLFLLYRDCGWD